MTFKENAEQSTPQCFGKEFESNDVVCVGGYDPTWTDEKGSHIRTPCGVRQACASRTAANKNLIASQSLVRPQQQQPAYPKPTSAAGVGYTPPNYSPQYPIWKPPVPVHPQQQQNQFSGNYAIPPYLSVREPSDLPTGKRFLLEAARSAAKALGHTIAHFFDTEPFARRQPENQPVEQTNAPPRPPS